MRCKDYLSASVRFGSEVRSGGYDRWVADWQSVQAGLITCWSKEMKIVDDDQVTRRCGS
jgi:hypothetical protein